MNPYNVLIYNTVTKNTRDIIRNVNIPTQNNALSYKYKHLQLV